MTARRRRRLPARVYWVRRAAVLVTTLALVFAVGRLVYLHAGGGSTQKAAPVAQQSPATSPQVSVAPPVATPSASPTPTPMSTTLSDPTGPCEDADVKVTPAVNAVAGGGQVVLPMNLTTRTSNACSWKVSSKSLVLKVARGDNRVWSSQDCPSTVPDQEVVVRPANEQPTQVLVPWDGHHSTQGCPAGQAWARPGVYTVTAASLGGDPTDADFRLVAPPRPTVTKTAKPKKKPTAAVSTPAG